MPNPATQAVIERARAHQDQDLKDLFKLLEQLFSLHLLQVGSAGNRGRAPF